MEALRQQLLAQLLLWAPNLGAAAGLLLGFWLLGRIAYHAVLRIGGRTRLRGPLSALLARTARIALLVLGVVTALGTLGADITGIVAGLGLTGFALGFALKDSISNLLAGVLLLVYRPFDVGNRIEVAGFAGRVVNIDLRYTELDAEMQRILLPNSKLLTDPIRVQKSG